MRNNKQNCRECGKPVKAQWAPNAEVSHMECAKKACADMAKRQADNREKNQKQIDEFQKKFPNCN